MSDGVFITLEGGEGVGKSTQLRALSNRLSQMGKSVVVTREPGGTEGAESIRKLLLDGTGERWTAQSEALLFAAARADHVARLIKPALSRGEWVLCDRYLESSRAYQGAGLGLGDGAICDLHRIGSGDFRATRILVLDLSEEAAAKRLAARGGVDRIEERGPAFHSKVRSAYRDMAAADTSRFRIIDADAPVDSVTDALMTAIADLL